MKSKHLDMAAIKFGCHVSFLEYIGAQDETSWGGPVLLLFNIMDPTHPGYGSTKTIKR